MNELKLLKAIENNARFDLNDLAKEMDIDRQTLDLSLKDLEKRKVICGYHTIINFDKTNNEEVTAVIEVSCTPRRESGYDEIAKEIYSYDEVSTMYLMSGKTEFLVIINGKTLAPIDGVTRTETYFILSKYKVEGVIINGESKKDDRLMLKL